MQLTSITLVDDDAPFREAVARVLRGAGHAVETCESGSQAWRVLQAEQPEVLITDLIMPEGDGVELISRVHSRFPAIRIIAVSGSRLMADLNLLSLARSLGAQIILDKPLDGEQLLNAVAEILG